MNQIKETVTLYDAAGKLCTITVESTEENNRTFRDMLERYKVEYQILDSYTADKTQVSDNVSESFSDYWERWENKPVRSWLESIQDMKG